MLFIYYTCILQAYFSSGFRCFQTSAASVLSGCCKSIYGCYIYIYVANICFKCFRCFRVTLQVFYIVVAKVDRDVAKVDRDVAYVAIAIHVCFKCTFYLFQMHVASVLSRYCKSISKCCIRV